MDGCTCTDPTTLLFIRKLQSGPGGIFKKKKKWMHFTGRTSGDAKYGCSGAPLCLPAQIKSGNLQEKNESVGIFMCERGRELARNKKNIVSDGGGAEPGERGSMRPRRLMALLAGLFCRWQP